MLNFEQLIDCKIARITAPNFNFSNLLTTSLIPYTIEHAGSNEIMKNNDICFQNIDLQYMLNYPFKFG